MRYAFAVLVGVPGFAIFAFSVVWGTLALWYKMPGPEALGWIAAAGFGILGLRTLVAMFQHVRWRWLAAYGAVLAAVLVFWASLVPPVEDNYAPEVSRQVTGTIDGDTLTLTNMRDFEWRGAGDATENWITRSYDMSTIESLDLFMSYWGGETMAHLMISFGFADGRFLVWSAEVRRSIGESFSPVADFFKANTVSIVASEEQDIIGLRSNAQRARVQLFRMNILPERRRSLLEAYVRKANDLAETPEFFNSVFSNCSMMVVRLAESAGAEVAFDWRLIVNGYLPEYMKERGVLSPRHSIEELYRLGDITERALSNGLTPDYPKAVREGVPVP
jgi:hypothetical protein